MLSEHYFHDRESLLQRPDVDWRSALKGLRADIERDVLDALRQLADDLRQLRDYMSVVANDSASAAAERTDATVARADVARLSAEATVARLNSLTDVDVHALDPHRRPFHDKAVRRHMAALDADISRMKVSAGIMSHEIDSLEGEKVRVSYLWNHSRRVARHLRRVRRLALWTARLYPLAHVATAGCALLITVIADRQTTLVETFANRLSADRSHDIALLIVFAVQFLGYERILSGVSQWAFRSIYRRLLVASRAAASEMPALLEHVGAISAGVLRIVENSSDRV